MIWYGLTQNTLSIPSRSKYSLVCTYLSLTEIAFSANNFNKLGLIQNVIRKILELKPEFILQAPMEYATDIIEPNELREFVIEKDLVMSFLRILLNHPKEGLVDNEFTRLLKEISSLRRKNLTEKSDFINKFYGKISDLKHVFKKYSSDKDWISDVRNLFLIELNEVYQKNYQIEKIDWSKFEFFEKVQSRYLRNLIVSKMKAQVNDFNDLQNMIYVQPDDLYWTLEKRWLTIAKEIRSEKYILQLNN